MCVWYPTRSRSTAEYQYHLLCRADLTNLRISLYIYRLECSTVRNWSSWWQSIVQDWQARSLKALSSIVRLVHFQMCERSSGASYRKPCLENSWTVFLSGTASKTSITCRISFWTWWSSRLKLGTSSSFSWWVYMPVDSKKSILILKYRIAAIIIIQDRAKQHHRKEINSNLFFLDGDAHAFPQESKLEP